MPPWRGILSPPLTAVTAPLSSLFPYHQECSLYRRGRQEAAYGKQLCADITPEFSYNVPEILGNPRPLNPKSPIDNCDTGYKFCQ